MIFHSLDFAAFFLIVVTIYWRLPLRAQNVLLLVASYVFYGWVHPWFVLIMLVSTTVDYWAGQRMEDDPARKRRYLWASLGVNLGMLGVFKYFNFFVENVRDVLAAMGLTVAPPLLEIALPAGISFYTFQALSYTVDVYKGEMRARAQPDRLRAVRRLLPAPGRRADHARPEPAGPGRAAAALGRRPGPQRRVLVIWGLLQEAGHRRQRRGHRQPRVLPARTPRFEVLWAGVFAFGMQIYADFSAYSDIARGVARWFGFELVVNFNHPYIAPARRLLAALAHLAVDLVPRLRLHSAGRQPRAALVASCTLITTFLVSGFWHGASWNYVLWGFYHGVLVWGTRAIGRALDLPEYWPGPLALVQIALTWTAMMAGWLFFRETNAEYLGHFLRLSPSSSMEGEAAIGLHFFILAATWSLPLLVHDLWALARERGVLAVSWIESRTTGLRLTAVQAAGVGVLASLTLVLRSTTSLDFIYFAF